MVLAGFSRIAVVMDMASLEELTFGGMGISGDAVRHDAHVVAVKVAIGDGSGVGGDDANRRAVVGRVVRAENLESAHRATVGFDLHNRTGDNADARIVEPLPIQYRATDPPQGKVRNGEVHGGLRVDARGDFDDVARVRGGDGVLDSCEGKPRPDL